MKKVLMIAFHYPPFQGSSGVHRTAKFSRYLSDHDWEPIVLTADPRAYPQYAHGPINGVGNFPVKRAFALDTTRHLSLFGSYLRCMALPDQWVSWWFSAVPAGLGLIRRYRPDVIWSTYPIATAHLIGLTLHRLSGIPWAADFRDSMTEESYPTDCSARYAYRLIERQTVKHCTRAIFTTPGTLRMYAERYPELPRSHWEIIANGYDEEDFIAVEERLVNAPVHSGKQVVLIHSGVIYPAERDPEPFFSAIATLRNNGKICSSSLKIVLRASGHENIYRAKLNEKQIDDIVQLEPAIPYQDALVEMMSSDGLLLFQAGNCNHQVPAKLYEYLRARRPIFALTDPAGDTAAVLSTNPAHTIVRLDSEAEIARGLLAFLTTVRDPRQSSIRNGDIERYSRRFQTRELADLLDSIV